MAASSASAAGATGGSLGWAAAAIGLGGVAAAAGGGGGGGSAAPAPTQSGSVIDGYLVGATVFIDRDGDGQLDAGEPSTKTDAQGNFTLPANVPGNLVAFGGTDKSTKLPFVGALRAPAGSTVVTPLTTLVSELVSDGQTAAQAQEAVLKALGLGELNDRIDLTSYDPLQQPADDADALAVQKAAVTVATLVSSLTSTLQVATDAGEEDIAHALFSMLADRLGDDKLGADSIGSTAQALIADLESAREVAGRPLQSLDASGQTLVSNLVDFAQRLQSVSAIDAIGSLQYDALTAEVVPHVRLLNASVDGLGDVLTLYFDQPLDAARPPVTEQFSVSNGSAQTITRLEVVDNRIVLHLEAAVDATKPVTVSYADATLDDADRAVQNRDGSDALAFQSVAVTNHLSLQATEPGAFALAGSLTLAGAEISAFDAASKRLFVTSAAGLQVVQVNTDLTMTLLGTVSLGSNDINSVAVKDGVVAVAVAATDKTQPGSVYFLDADGTLGDAAMVLGSVEVGALPDMLSFSADGKKVLVANEGERNLPADVTAGKSAIDPEGSVSIIDLSAGIAAAKVTTASFAAFNDKLVELKAAGVRLFAGEAGFESVSVAQDLEPEYISIAPDGRTAFVTLQENNAVAILDLESGQFTDIVPLGLKSFLGLPFDGSDKDGLKAQTDQPVFGQYMPDAIASFVGADGKTYYVIANEGDDRDDFINPDETIRAAKLKLDAEAFPDAAALKTDAELGRLTVSNAPGNNGDTDGDGDIDQLLSYGARSFSILNTDGVLVFDSGSHIEQFVASGGLFNATTPATGGLFDDTRSDNKGPEPEGVALGQVGDRTLAFIGLERGGGGVMVYDVTDPAAVSFVQYLRNPADVSLEGLSFVGKADSPNGQDLLFVTNEVSNTVTAYRNTTFTLQLLHFSDAEAGLLAAQTAPYLAAMVDKFEDEYANSITLTGGDNSIPGPFLAAGTDASVIDELNAVTGSTLAANATVPIGAVDVALLNAIGVEASAIGNHDYDLGSRVLKDAIAGSSGSKGAQFPYVSANLDLSGDADLKGLYTNTVANAGLEAASTLKGKIVPSTVLIENGEKIGLVGATTQILENISSPSGTKVKDDDSITSDDLELLAAQLQPVIDDLIAQGVNKIILMAHLQVIGNEKQLASLLSGVDIILAAGSNTRLGDADDTAVAFPGHSANFADTYPLVIRDKDGRDTLIVNTDNEYTYLGRLVVDFDANGHLILDSLAANAAINGAHASTAENVAAAWGVGTEQLETTAFAEGTRGDAVQTLTEAVQSVIQLKDGQVFGYSDVYLEGERAAVRSEETNFGNLSADANAHAAALALGAAADTSFIVSLKNGGGIRAQIGTLSAPDPVDGSVDKLPPPDGSVSQLDVENALRFNNQLMMFDTTAAGLKAILEHGVAAGTLQGRFPQLGGVAFSWNPELSPGARVRDIALIGDGYHINLYNDGVLLDDVPAQISVVTLNFLANGGDGYPMKANGENFRYLMEGSDGEYSLSAAVDEALNFTEASVIAAHVTGGNVLLGEQAALATYLQTFHASPETAFDAADTPATLDERIQNLNLRNEAVLDLAAPAPTPDVTLISTLQGIGSATTLANTTHWVEAVVTAVMPEMGGFWLQEERADSDGNPASSEGLFVYHGNTAPGITITAANVGDTVRVRGQIVEYNGVTELKNVSDVSVIRDGGLADLPPAAILTLPVVDYALWEQYEGMRVEVRAASGDLVVTDNYNLGRYGQVTLTSGSLLEQYTQSNAPSVEGNTAYNGVLRADQIILDDGSSKQNPDPVDFARNGADLSAGNTLRAGDATQVIRGILDQFATGSELAYETTYRVQATEDPLFAGAPRPTASDLQAALGTAEVKVASVNVLNFFTTLGTTSFTTPDGIVHAGRGADDAAEYQRQLAKLVDNLIGLDADVYGLMEIQNNGFGEGSALDALVDALNARVGENRYAAIQGPFADGTATPAATAGDDAIMVALIYDATAVAPLGGAAVPDSSVYDAFSATYGNRVPVAQTFQSLGDGETFTVVVNHLKSKGSVLDPDTGDGQGANNLARMEGVRDLTAWLATNPTGAPDGDILLVGDLNAYAAEDPVSYLESQGYERVSDGLSYSFDGLWGALDHALASTSLADQVSGVVEWAINAEEPGVLDYNTNFKTPGQVQSLYAADAYRSSDHNPLLIGLNLSGAAPDTTAPVLQSARVDGVTLTLTYSENLQPAALTALRAFTVTVDGQAGPAVESVKVLGSTATLTLAAAVAHGDTVLLSYTDPSAADDANVLQDIVGNDAATVAAYAVSNLTPVPDTAAPQLISSTPATGASAVATTANLVLNFDEPVLKGSGAITIRHQLNGLLLETIDVASSQVSVDGKRVTIDPARTLALGKGYVVEIAAGAFADAAGNDFAGLAGAGALKFTAISGTPVFISEIHYDDSTSTGDINEGVGIFGAAGTDLTGWKVVPYNGSGGVAYKPTGSLSPAALLSGLIDDEGQGYGELFFAINGLQNGAPDGLALVDKEGKVVQFLSYEGSFTATDDRAQGLTSTDIGVFETNATPPGQSLQLAGSGVLYEQLSWSDPSVASMGSINAKHTIPAAPPSGLGVGDLVFLAANADSTDAFAFAVLKDVAQGTQIGFSDRNYSATTGFAGLGNEAAFVWTADQAYEAGTVVTIQPDGASGTNPLADKGTVQGAGGGISTNAETIYAFLGEIAGLADGAAGEITVDQLLASINVGGGGAGDIPASIAATSVSFVEDNARYNGGFDFTEINTFVSAAGNPANWSASNDTAFALSNNSLFPGA